MKEISSGELRDIVIPTLIINFIETGFELSKDGYTQPRKLCDEMIATMKGIYEGRFTKVKLDSAKAKVRSIVHRVLIKYEHDAIDQIYAFYAVVQKYMLYYRKHSSHLPEPLKKFYNKWEKRVFKECNRYTDIHEGTPYLVKSEYLSFDICKETFNVDV